MRRPVVVFFLVASVVLLAEVAEASARTSYRRSHSAVALPSRVRRQQCTCVRVALGPAVQCSCDRSARQQMTNGQNGGSTPTPVSVDVPQRDDTSTQLSNELASQNGGQCACVQLIIRGVNQYQCKCQDSSTAAPTTTAYTHPYETTEPVSTTHSPPPPPVTTSTTLTTRMTATTTDEPPTPPPYSPPSTESTTHPTTTSTTTRATTTTTTQRTTTTTTEPATTTVIPPITVQPTSSGRPGLCHCIMIQISAPAAAQYQCSCDNPVTRPHSDEGTTTPTTTTTTTTTTTRPTTTTTLPTTTTTLPTTTSTSTTTTTTPAYHPTTESTTTSTTTTTTAATTTTTHPTTTTTTTGAPTTTTSVPSTTTTAAQEYPAIGTTPSNGTTQQGCFCLDQAPVPCGCACDCSTLTVSQPNGVCVCPQALLSAADMRYYATAPALFSSPTATAAAAAAAAAAARQPYVYQQSGASYLAAPASAVYPQYQSGGGSEWPTTTTCVMFAGAASTPCICIPEYEQCAPNVCCLKARYRSHKAQQLVRTIATAAGAEPATVDMLFNVLQKLKANLKKKMH